MSTAPAVSTPAHPKLQAVRNLQLLARQAISNQFPTMSVDPKMIADACLALDAALAPQPAGVMADRDMFEDPAAPGLSAGFLQQMRSGPSRALVEEASFRSGVPQALLVKDGEPTETGIPNVEIKTCPTAEAHRHQAEGWTVVYAVDQITVDTMSNQATILALAAIERARAYPTEAPPIALEAARAMLRNHKPS